MRYYYSVMTMVLVVFVGFGSLHAKGKDSDMILKDANVVIEEYLAKYEPLDLKIREYWFKYNTTGDKNASKKEAETTLAIRKLNSNKERFAKLQKLYKDRKDISNSLVRRQIELLYLAHLPNQVSDEQLKKLTELEKKLGEGFNDFTPTMDGKKTTFVEVEHILSDSTDSNKLEKAWKAKHLVAPVLEKDYRDMVKLRNEIARNLGYKNALELSATVAELDVDMLNKFYSDVAKATDKPFKKLKEEYIDTRLAKRYGIEAKDLKPWHYQNAYFQEAPTAIFGAVDLDSLYSKTDSNKVIKLVEDFYGSMGVDVTGIIKNSSLFPKPGKNPHAFAWFLDPNKAGSAVLLMNLPPPPKAPKAAEASTLVHELAHDINYEAILKNKGLPYILRDPTMLTEAVAELFQRQTNTVDWFKKLGVSDEVAGKTAAAVGLIDYVDQLIFLRWSAVIYCFENKFYADPDSDIGALWWECKEKHQLLARPEGWKNPDALAKYHIPNVSPLYYSNYAIGRVANVQFVEMMAKKIGENPEIASYFGKKQLGDWLMNDFLAQGQKYRWDDFIKLTTGEPFSVAPWKKYYIGSQAEKKLYK